MAGMVPVLGYVLQVLQLGGPQGIDAGHAGKGRKVVGGGRILQLGGDVRCRDVYNLDGDASGFLVLLGCRREGTTLVCVSGKDQLKWLRGIGRAPSPSASAGAESQGGGRQTKDRLSKLATAELGKDCLL
jgi:hypothetical protein